MRHSVIAGLPVLIFGAVLAAISSTYPLGSMARMGPGYLPLVCGIVLMLLGLAIVLFDRETLSAFDHRRLARPTLAVLGGLAGWALTVERLGLVVATVLLVGLVSLAQPRPNWRTAALAAVVLATLGVTVFIIGLGIRLKAFGG